MASRRAWELASEVFQRSAQQGRAELSYEDDPGEAGATIRILPTASEAAAIELAIDGAVLSVSLGPQRHVVEIALQDPRWDGLLQALLEAVVQGKYEERVERGVLGQKLVMSFETDAGRMTFKHLNLVDPPDAAEGSRRYAPY
jgi:hypothetical protein